MRFKLPKYVKSKANGGAGYPKAIFTEKEIQEIEELAPRLTMAQIADHFGISLRNLYYIRERQEEVDRSYKRGRTKGIRHVVGKLMESIDNCNATSIIFYLKTQAGWKDISGLEITGDTAPRIVVQFDNVEKLVDDSKTKKKKLSKSEKEVI